ncbi:MAG: hypothetical protein ACREHV_01045 [Rhizomicrobium sp.]
MNPTEIREEITELEQCIAGERKAMALLRLGVVASDQFPIEAAKISCRIARLERTIRRLQRLEAGTPS